MRGHTRVFPGQNPALIGHELLQKVDVLKIQSVEGEVDLGLGTRCASLRCARAITSFRLGIPIGVGFARHKSYLISL